ncbi:MAG: hypothetical protein OEN22_00855 [Gammaproteobacteria bacterium]|nr:hypothetical protein [Gammaproteobacteria bacterium]
MKSLATILGTSLVFTPILLFAELHVVVVEGLSGESRYAEEFDVQITAIETAAKSLTSPERIRIFRAADASREVVLAHFNELAATLSASDRVVVYLIGHGSYDEYDYKFNISGPDLTGQDIAQVLDALPNSNQLLVDTSSSSGALADLVKNEDRVVILATRSGAERHATHFGVHFATALSDPEADTDKNQLVSAQEAFSYAERRVSDYFERNGQLSTEHAKIEGPQADRFPLARLSPARPAGIGDPELGELLERRNALNASIDELRLARDRMPVEEYRSALLEQMLELARLEKAIEEREQEFDSRD